MDDCLNTLKKLYFFMDDCLNTEPMIIGMHIISY